MKRSLLLVFLFGSFVNGWSKDTLSVCSPSGKICVKVWRDKQIKYSIYNEHTALLDPSGIDLILNNGDNLSSGAGIRHYSIARVSNEIVVPVPEKRKFIHDDYNILSITSNSHYKVEFRVYDDAVAYRISTHFKDSITIQSEVAEFRFPGQPAAYFPEVHKREDADIFHTSFEELYPLKKLEQIQKTSIAYSPVLIVPSSNPKIGITESDLEDYPGMFLQGTGASALRGIFAGYPLEEKITEGEFPEALVIRRANYIAKTKGTRSFPWRILIIAPEDKDLPSNDVAYRLASPSRIGDASWVSPGKGTDEWTINVNLFNVPFRSGVNTASYKYYIDFAKRFGFNRIMMDAGWSDNKDLFKINQDINMDTLTAYAKEKGIKISMWTLALTLNRQLDSALERFNKWGVDFIMTDFMDRDDQQMVNFYKRIAERCAEHHIMIMFHGAYPPKGFNRTYPNAITREGVLGSEYNIGSDKASPEHDVTLPFTRMLAGSMDYEPGILNNATKKGFRPIEGMVMSQGTRCHQLAMFVVYDNPMEIFSGNPSQGATEPKFMEFLGSLPTTWDETTIIDGKVAAYIITARKKGQDWFVGGMTDWTPRDITLSFNFLGEGNYMAEVCKDGVNADRYAADYIIEKVPVNRNDKWRVHLAPGGGFVVRLIKTK